MGYHGCWGISRATWGSPPYPKSPLTRWSPGTDNPSSGDVTRSNAGTQRPSEPPDHDVTRSPACSLSLTVYPPRGVKEFLVVYARYRQRCLRRPQPSRWLRSHAELVLQWWIYSSSKSSCAALCSLLLALGVVEVAFVVPFVVALLATRGRKFCLSWEFGYCRTSTRAKVCEVPRGLGVSRGWGFGFLVLESRHGG